MISIPTAFQVSQTNAKNGLKPLNNFKLLTTRYQNSMCVNCIFQASVSEELVQERIYCQMWFQLFFREYYVQNITKYFKFILINIHPFSLDLLNCRHRAHIEQEKISPSPIEELSQNNEVFIFDLQNQLDIENEVTISNNGDDSYEINQLFSIEL